MIDLELLGIDADGQGLILSDATGKRYRLAIDSALTMAVRRPTLSNSQSVADPGAPKPRVIQSLIRAGLTASEIASMYDCSTDQIKRFETAVLSERKYIVSLARETAFNPQDLSIVFEDLVLSRLASRGVATETVSWDATRQKGEDWVVTVEFSQAAQPIEASWRFDPHEGLLVPLNEEASWMLSSIATPPASSSSASASKAQLKVSTPSAAPVSETTPETISNVTPLLDRLAQSRGMPENILTEDIHEASEPEAYDGLFSGGSEDADTASASAKRAEPERRGRKSVPGWEEIMLGTRKNP